MDSGSTSEGTRRLASGKCVPCGDAKPFTVEEATERLKDLPGWLLQSASIQKEFRFRSYLAGFVFAYSLGKFVKLENHPPDFFFGWRGVKVFLSTNAIRGLS